MVSGTQFAGIWTDDNNDETLFRIRYANSTTIGGLFTATGGNIYIAPSDKLIQALDVSDIRKTAYIGTDANGNNYVNKFYASSRGGRAVDLKACRTAEMYLIRAESYAKKSSPDVLAGGMDLNTLRANRITGYVDESFFNAYNLKVATIEERYKELAFEGFRFFDLKRCSLPVQRLSSDASAAWQNLEVGSFRFVLPVPNSEILANPNMQQNSGY